MASRHCGASQCTEIQARKHVGEKQNMDTPKPERTLRITGFELTTKDRPYTVQTEPIPLAQLVLFMNKYSFYICERYVQGRGPQTC